MRFLTVILYLINQNLVLSTRQLLRSIISYNELNEIQEVMVMSTPVLEADLTISSVVKSAVNVFVKSG